MLVRGKVRHAPRLAVVSQSECGERLSASRARLDHLHEAAVEESRDHFSLTAAQSRVISPLADRVSLRSPVAVHRYVLYEDAHVLRLE